MEEENLMIPSIGYYHSSIAFQDDESTLCFFVRNDDYACLPKYFLEFEENGFFFGGRAEVKALEPTEEVDVPMTLLHKQSRTVDDIPNETIVLLKDESGKIIKRSDWSNSFSWFMHKFSDLIPKRHIETDDYHDISPPLNMLVLGPLGMGKTCFIQVLLTLLQKNRDAIETVNDLVVGTFVDGGHVTKEFRLHSLLGTEYEEFLQIWDTFGMSEETYNGNEIDILLDGLMSEEGILAATVV